MFSSVVHLYWKIKIVLVAVCMCFLLIILYLYNYNDCKRLKYIIDIPVTAFDKNGHLVDEEWINFLKVYKPIGIIFFAEHLEDKAVAKQMIFDVKKVINEKHIFIAADEEGGRVNRMGWVNDSLSASDIARKYVQLKVTKDSNAARLFAEQEFSKIFKEMMDVGLNLDFAPNLDINIYEDMVNIGEYKFYKQAEEYVNVARKKRKDLLDDYERFLYAKTIMFYAYLDEIGVKSLDNFSIDGKIDDNESSIEKIRQQWKLLDEQERNDFINDFKHVAKYANYASVVGDRSFGNNFFLIAEIADIFVKTAKKFNIKCTIKHLLGHGRALGDTHNGTEYVDTPVETILQDLYPYKFLIEDVNFAMPADIVYASIDDEKSAMGSEKVLNFFREHIGNAIFIGDDIVIRDGVIVKQKCDIHLKIHNKRVDDVLQFINNDDYLGKGIWEHWFE